VFKEGVTSKQVRDAKSFTDLMLTFGLTEANGKFSMKAKIPKGTYSMAVVGQGYKVIIDDNALVIDGETPPTYRPWRTLEVTRCSSGTDCIE
jgi:hypothetical protein